MKLMKHFLKGNQAVTISQNNMLMMLRCRDIRSFSKSNCRNDDQESWGEGERKNKFLEKDYRNYIYCKWLAVMEKGDAEAVLEYFQKKKDNLSLFYSMQHDENDMITNIF